MVVATLIGDLVASRRHADRRAVQRLVAAALERVNARLAPVQPLEPTIGDEFQGAFATVGAAVRASLLLRLELLGADGTVDSRYGIGYGEVTVFDATRTPTSQDGPGWWAARTAIDRTKLLEGAPRTSAPRTSFEAAEGAAATAYAPAVDAFLLTRDAAVERMNPRQLRLLLGLLGGRRQTELADEEGIRQSAVSWNLQRSGAYGIAAALDRLDAL